MSSTGTEGRLSHDAQFSLGEWSWSVGWVSSSFSKSFGNSWLYMGLGFGLRGNRRGTHPLCKFKNKMSM